MKKETYTFNIFFSGFAFFLSSFRHFCLCNNARECFLFHSHFMNKIDDFWVGKKNGSDLSTQYAGRRYIDDIIACLKESK